VEDCSEDFEGTFWENGSVGYLWGVLCAAGKRIGGCRNGDTSVGHVARFDLGWAWGCVVRVS
jgi:hypothetical protein